MSAPSKSRLAIYLLAGIELTLIALILASGYWTVHGQWMGEKVYGSVMFYGGVISAEAYDHTGLPAGTMTLPRGGYLE